MTSVSRRDRIIVHLLCLTPLQRARLDRLRDFHGPASCSQIAASGSLPSVRRNLEKFRAAALVLRTGISNSTRHCLYGDVAALMDGCPSIGNAATGWEADTALAVLEAVRAIRGERRVPGVTEVAARAGIERRAARLWMRRLMDAGLTGGLPQYSSPREWARNTTA